MRILVVGGAGFIGSHVCAHLREAGHDLHAYDQGSANAPDWLKDARVRYAGVPITKGDLLDLPRLLGTITKYSPDMVINLAAKPGVGEAEQNPAPFDEVNVVGVVRLLEACRRGGVRHLVHASSSSVYGNRSGMLREEHEPAPVGHYGRTKLLGERYIEQACCEHGLSARILRPFTVIGPLGRPDMAAWKFAEQIRAGMPVTLHQDASRDFTPVHDLARAFVASVERPWSGLETINVGSGECHPVVSLAQLLADSMDRPLKTKVLAKPDYLPTSTCADSSGALRLLDWRPRLPFAEAVRDFGKWYVSQEYDEEK